MVTTNLFWRPVFKEGAFTANDPRIRRFAGQEGLRGHRAGGRVRGAGVRAVGRTRGHGGRGRQGRPPGARPLQRSRSTSSASTSRRRGLGLRIALEPKPNEPRGDILLPTVGHALAFIGTLERPEMVGLNPEFAHETMSGLSFSQAVAQTLWQDKLFHIDLNAQRIGKFDQDFRFGSEGIRDAFYVVKLLEDAGWDGMRHFDAHPYRTEDADGVWDFARGCMRTYLILADKARRFHEDPEIQEALRAAKVAELAEPTAPAGGLDELLSSALRRGRARGAGLRPRAPGPARHRTAARGALVPLVVGVDSSTSACKVQVRDVDTGAVVASGPRRRIPPTSPPRSEQHPAGLGGRVPRRLRRGRRLHDATRPRRDLPSRRSSTGSSSSTTTARSCGRPSSGTTPSPRPTPRMLLAALAGRPAAGPPRAGASPCPASRSPSCTGCAAASPRPCGAPRRSCCRTTGSPSGSRAGGPPTGATPRAPATGRPREARYRVDLLRWSSDDVDWEAALPEVLAPDAVAGEWAATGALVGPGTGRQHGGRPRSRPPPGRPGPEPRHQRHRVHGRATSRRPTPPAPWPASPTRPAATCRWSAP